MCIWGLERCCSQMLYPVHNPKRCPFIATYVVSDAPQKLINVSSAIELERISVCVCVQ